MNNSIVTWLTEKRYLGAMVLQPRGRGEESQDLVRAVFPGAASPGAASPGAASPRLALIAQKTRCRALLALPGDTGLKSLPPNGLGAALAECLHK